MSALRRGLIVLAGAGVIFSLTTLNTPVVKSDAPPTPAPTPTIDRLATPVMPESPTPLDLGRHVYYQDCMPCHGDRGQGLTDEWRAAWVEDHQDCWAVGCHGGHVEDEGFRLPRTVPAVIETGLTKFQTEQALYDFLVQTQPPQRPGKLTEAEYQEVAQFLWAANHRSAPPPDATALGLGVAGLVVGVIAMGYVIRRITR